jgi:hypothetical protein
MRFTAEVIRVLAKPFSLAGSFAGLTAFWLTAVFLFFAISGIWSE